MAKRMSPGKSGRGGRRKTLNVDDILAEVEAAEGGVPEPGAEAEAEAEPDPGPARPEASAGAARDPVEAAMDLAAVQGWRGTSLADIAVAAGLPLSELYASYPSKAAILAALMRRVDEAMLSIPADPADTTRDRLFDVVMRRLDALAPYKPALRSILREAPFDPATLAGGSLTPVRRTITWMLEAAGIEAGGLAGLLRMKGLALIYLDTMRVWLDDESPDAAKTMAALDRRLRQAESLLGMLPGRLRRRDQAGV